MKQSTDVERASTVAVGMGFFSRRRGHSATIREMSRFTDAEREQGMDMLQAAEDLFVDLGAPSRPGTTLVTLAAASMGVEQCSPMYGVAAGAALMGYSCRMVHRPREIPDRIAD